ncbi:Stealth CR1 domain-containing protein [Lactiplantibacillus argentoratensis]|uniref:Stealth CR1 domain-containing protein n=1 Tax=Lactiplantibacillus argentoratensis TaxID=271881 RepID=A0ABS5UGH6_9LACO|nr:Stealth CR1 domain-containing protein [Lactiplantibacillus argentoratensis]KZU13887.1 Receptor polysaccharide phosphotransferase wefC [Lactiplantibacillus plantarum]MBT1137465.1 Stealth CR1 domain-containing protein [Lactiplantibacillus argentoratensis]MBT1140323.1 Stealth CR1 domain-containing protein [Lactiplantibacillus argentoratensis]
MTFPIDFVVTWVDGSDPVWVAKKNKYLTDSQKIDANDARYRDYGLLKNWFDRVWRYAPWVNNVYLITDNQAPDWAVKDSRITTVNHDDFIPKQYLPTFNSNVIEMNLWRINELNEHFVCFNDDMFLTQPVKKEDFFTGDGLPVLNGSLRPIIAREMFSKSVFNNMLFINKTFPKKDYFRKHMREYLNVRKYGIVSVLVTISNMIYHDWVGFFEDHLAYPNLKSWFWDLNRTNPEVFEKTSSHRFRSTDDFSIWLLKNAYLATGFFSPRSRNFGEMLGVSNINDLKKVKQLLKSKKMVVVNDSIDGVEADMILNKLVKLMEI